MYVSTHHMPGLCPNNLHVITHPISSSPLGEVSIITPPHWNLTRVERGKTGLKSHREELAELGFKLS
jgi:hypothetical protein